MVHKFLATSIITTGTFAYVVRPTKFNAIITMESGAWMQCQLRL